MKSISRIFAVFAVIAIAGMAQGQDKKPNILFIMGDDIGIMNVGAYHQGLMVGETPNIDRLAREGGRFMDYYAMQSCTSGRCASSRACIRSVSASRCLSFRAAPPGCVLARRRSQKFCLISVTQRASSERTTSATTLSHYQRRRASRNTGVTCITSMRCSRSASLISTARQKRRALHLRPRTHRSRG